MIACCILALQLADPAPDIAPFPTALPAAVGIDPAALERLKIRAGRANSDAVLIVKDGKIIADWTFGKSAGPIEAMSATKSVVNLAVGRLIDQKKIRSIDQPVFDFYPEWRQGRKRLITIRHLLNHTSGLQNDPFDRGDLRQPRLRPICPGGRSERRPRRPLLLQQQGRQPARRNRPEGLGPEDGRLHRRGDLQADGHYRFPMVAGQSGQSARDGGAADPRRRPRQDRPDDARRWYLAGTPGGERGVGSPLDRAARPAARPDLWAALVADPGPESYVIDDAMVADLKEQGLTEGSLKKIEEIKGKEFDMEGIWAALRPILHTDQVVGRKVKELDDRLRKTGRPKPKRVISGAVEGFEALGYRGQYLVVLPRRRVVAVRQLRAPASDVTTTDDFGEFRQMVRDLTSHDPPKAAVPASPAERGP